MPDPDIRCGPERPLPQPPERVTQRPRDEKELGFKHQKMVHWLDPKQLINSALRAILASVFGTYADKRELQAALTDDGKEVVDLDLDRKELEKEVWVDYVADVGEGFASTYTIAWLLAQKELPIPHEDPKPKLRHQIEVHGGNVPAAPLEPGTGIRRGQILVMGGDEVYPTPSQEEYANRMAGPYDAALPCVSEHEECPFLFAIPGNHDWYDGLTSFIRQFCQGRMIGAWKTKQKRSYWAVKLPHGWWLWGTDIQLGADIDKPQLDYFTRVARSACNGDRVILCTAEPSWVDLGKKQAWARLKELKRRKKLKQREAAAAAAADAAAGKGGAESGLPQGSDDDSEFGNLAYFERKVIRANNLVLAVTLTGDDHQYVRYSYRGPEGESVHKVTAGGGGAHLAPTHHLPDTIDLIMQPAKEGQSPVSVTLERRVRFPDEQESRDKLAGLGELGTKNPGMAKLLGIVYAVFAGALHLAIAGWPLGEPLMKALTGTFAMVALLAAGFFFLVGFILSSLSHGGDKRARTSAALLHGAAHALFATAATGLLTWLNVEVLPRNPGLVQAFGFAASTLLMFAVGSWVGPWVMGAYLRLADRWEVNSNDAFAAQSLEDYKNFLRMRVTADAVTIWPIGVRNIISYGDWVFDPGPQSPEESRRKYKGKPYLRPGKQLFIELIEEPIRIFRDVRLPYK